ncbi:GTP-binding protein Rhb1 [Trichinella spiralis]|uniref:GTP-binding protein Rhb1 n=1 Tax=Trichinella spiralis TaxID=6334 RepID=UPI0001EFC030|nr:GTP-binding protein Rhb1 [Trichinella spiralis]
MNLQAIVRLQYFIVIDERVCDLKYVNLSAQILKRNASKARKSSLSLQFTENRFPDSYDPTIENTFTKEFTFHNQRYLMQLHDTSGQDEFSMFPINCSIGIHGYVLVYAINSRKSFDVVKVIYDKILDTVGCVSEQERDVANIPIILVGNKSDLDDRVREVTYDEGKKTADKWKAAFMETTARNNEANILLFILYI